MLSPRTPKRFERPDLKTANDDTSARERADAIKTGAEAYARNLKALQSDAWKRRKDEQRQLWNDYRTARQAITARHQFQIDQVYKHRRDRHALPLSIQGFRDWKESREWKKLMERLKAEKRRFDYRERTLTGFLANTLALVRPGMQRTGKGFLPMLFNLLVSGNQRREIMTARQALAKRALSDKQFGSRKYRAGKIKIVRDAQTETLSRAYDIQKQALDLRHEQEIVAQKQAWRDLSAERKKQWDAWHAEFGTATRRQRTDQGSQGGDDRARSPAPLRPRSQFADAGRPGGAQPGQLQPHHPILV
jgi:hypothetical protein